MAQIPQGINYWGWQDLLANQIDIYILKDVHGGLDNM